MVPTAGERTMRVKNPRAGRWFARSHLAMALVASCATAAASREALAQTTPDASTDTGAATSTATADAAARAHAWRTWQLPLPPGGPDILPDESRPAATRGCVRSNHAPVCVHATAGVSPERLADIVRAFDRAASVIHAELRMPEPAPDGDRGGGPELDVYVGPLELPFDVGVDPPEGFAPWDRAPCFVRVRADVSGASLERAAAEAYLHAVMLGTDARTAPAWRAAWAASLAARARGLPIDSQALERFQRQPARALIADRERASARGAALFFDYLAREHDTADARMLRGLLWMPVARTPADAPRWLGVPDGFDVLERMFRGESGGIDAMLTEFTLHRALVGTDGDTHGLVPGEHGTELAIEPLARVDITRLPQWVTPARGLEETGAAVVLVDTRQAHEATLNVWFHGVPWRQWALSVVRLDARMRVIGRVPRPIVEHGEWSSVLESLDGVAHVLVVVVDLGNRDYHPDLPTPGLDFFALNFSRS